MNLSLPAIAAKVTAHRPRKAFWRRWSTRAAVTAVLTDRPELGGSSVLLMRRTTREGDPWSGHMSFPGGRQDQSDRHVYDTAVRELAEETGLHIHNHGAYLGRLSDVMARPQTLRRRPLIVTPFVFHLQHTPTWNIDPREVEELLWVPISFLADESNRGEMNWSRGKMSFTLPCYDYEGRRIWGLTLKMLDELLEVILQSK